MTCLKILFAINRVAIKVLINRTIKKLNHQKETSSNILEAANDRELISFVLLLAYIRV